MIFLLSNIFKENLSQPQNFPHSVFIFHRKMLNLLPEELVHEIFEYLPGREILNCSRSCSIFHSIIEKSKALTSKLTLCFEKQRKYCQIGKRKYSKLYVGYVDPSIHYILLKLLGENITKVTFCDYDFRLDAVRRVLIACKNVKDLRFEGILRIHGVAEVKLINYSKI